MVGATAGERAPAGSAGASPLPIYLLAGTTFASLAVRGVLFPLHAAALGANRFEIGLLFTSFTVTAALLSLPSGYLADRVGRRPMLVGALLTGGVSQVAGALTDSVTMLIVFQAIGGLGAGASQAVVQAILADIVPSSRMGRAMGWLTLSFQTGFLTGPALAGFLLQFVSIRTDLIVTTLLLVAALPMTLAAAPTVSRVTRPPIQNLSALREISRRPAFAAILIGLFAATLVWGTVQGFLPIFGQQQLKLPNSQIGYLISIQAIANGLARVPGGFVVDRIKRRGPIALGGVALYSVMLFVLPHLSGFWAPAILLSLTVPLLATAFIAISVAFVDLSTPATRGIAMGLYGAVLYIGLGFGPLVFGPLMERYGYAVGFSVCAVTVIALTGIGALARTASVRRHRVGMVTETGG